MLITNLKQSEQIIKWVFNVTDVLTIHDTSNLGDTRTANGLHMSGIRYPFVYLSTPS